jgi:NAD(P)-dependent dehydrogenase (short-subunit alcohol dehydrogenase family)
MSGTKRHSSALIIGASRGLGLALAKEYLARGWQVTATVRGSARTGLHALAQPAEDRLAIEQLDINDAGQTRALRARLHGRHFDLLFVNAGVSNGREETLATATEADFVQTMLTNAYSPMRVIETLADLVTENGTIGVMSSGLGSVSNNTSGGWEIYRGSKAALNTFMRSYAVRQGGGRAMVIIAPGWVRTDMGGPDATLSIEESIPGVADAIGSRAGKPGLVYLDYRGQTVPW